MSVHPDARAGDIVVASRQAALARYRAVRLQSEALCRPLAIEDYGVQSMADVSPPKWHIAHMTWFFETFLLKPEQPGYRPFHPAYEYLFNSYYNAVGPQYPRPERGLLARPTVAQVYAYRRHVDETLARLIERAPAAVWPRLAALLLLGINHEQQHQELLLYDVKHNFAHNPLKPAYRHDLARSNAEADGTGWHFFAGGVHAVGHGGEGFAFDNEGPRHEVLLGDFRLAGRLITIGEFFAFLEDGGYARPELWLSDGWATVQREGWRAPLYWEAREGAWRIMTLGGERELNWDEPVCHVSYYEADAFARWRGKRLATEEEWEVAAEALPREGNFVEADYLHPVPAGPGARRPAQMFGDLWEWTQSPYVPYRGYRAPAGAVGEYNGKFMSNQMVLRGGSCASPKDHIRASYRNFFYPHQRWMFAGIRLAEDVP